MHVPAKLLVFMEVTCVFIDQEVVSWKTQWDAKNHCDTPDTITGTLTSTSVSYVRFPNIVTILRLLLLVPVTAASAERAHSALKLVKTDRRSTMTEDRMTALLLLHVHKRHSSRLWKSYRQVCKHETQTHAVVQPVCR
jgi:hypothetical protein